MPLAASPQHLIRSRASIIHLGDNGILYVSILEGLELEIQDIRDIAKGIVKAGKGKKHPLLITLGSKTSAEKSVQEFVAKQGPLKYIQAIAYVVTSATQKLVLNFFVLFHSPALPTRIFNQENDAIQWLKKFS